MAFGPPGSEPFFRDNLPSSIGLIEAWRPDFGDCLFTAIDRMLRLHGAAVVLNSDSPTLPTSLLVETARMLARSTDGGYYLLGIKARHRHLFERVSWSTEHVMRQTLERAAEIGVHMHVLPAWYDVDDSDSLKLLRSELFDGWSFAAPLRRHHAGHTGRLLRRLLDTTDLSRRLMASPTMRRAAE